MNTQEIAQLLLYKRNSMNPLIQQGQLAGELGSDGLQEALRRRWLIPDMDSGFLQINNQLAVVEDIRRNAELCEVCGSKECKCGSNNGICRVCGSKGCTCVNQQESAAHSFVMEHAHVKSSVVQGVVQELLAPATGHDNSAPMTTPAQPPPAPPPPRVPTAPRSTSPEVGDSVMVTQEGKTYTGVVGALKDGRYTVSFGGMEKPANEETYGPEQLRLVKKANA